MARFTCDRCGKCCVSLGRHITIERQLNDRDYYCRCAIDNTVFPAAVDPACRDEVAAAFETAGTGSPGQVSEPCIFLRKSPDGTGTVCAIYASRPKVCREFRCYRMLIHTKEHAVCGRVIGKNTLRTDDPVLENLWNDRILPLPAGDQQAWTRRVDAILAEHGYSAEPAE